MKALLIKISFIMFFSSVFSQNKNYTVNSGGNITGDKSKSEFTILKIEQSQNPIEPKGAVAAVALPFLVGQIPKIPEYVSKVLKNSKKKYTAEYSAKNSLTFQTDDFLNLPKLTLKRHIVNAKGGNELATLIELTPILVKGEYLAFSIGDIQFNYSKAKIKKEYTHINLLIEVAITYGSLQEDNSIKKTEVKSAAIKIPVNATTKTIVNTDSRQNLTGVFSLKNLFEISVKVTEVNPYKVNIENIEAFAEDFKEPISEFFTKLGESLKD